MADVALDAFESDRRKRWLVERGTEIISEASRRLPDELKARHPEIPWPKVAGIGNVLRHNYEDVAAPVMWKLVREDLPLLERFTVTRWQSSKHISHSRTGSNITLSLRGALCDKAIQGSSTAAALACFEHAERGVAGSGPAARSPISPGRPAYFETVNTVVMPER